MNAKEEIDTIILDCVSAVKAWDGREIKVETNFLDDESFVVNFKRIYGFGTRECIEGYAVPFVMALGAIAERELNRLLPKDGGRWVCYSEENYWTEDGKEVGPNDRWDTIQCCVYWDCD